MIRRSSLNPAARQLLIAQDGVISRQQALGTGLSPGCLRGLLDVEVLAPLTRGIYARPGSSTWRGLAWAGLLLGGNESVLGLEAAAHLHGLIPQPPATISVWVGRSAQPRALAGWQFIRAARRGRGELTRTSVEDTILDLADTSDDDALCRLMADAICARLTTSQHLLKSLEGRRSQPKRRLIEDVLADVDDGAMSPLERRYGRDVEQAHGLPRGLRQASARRYVSDVRYEAGLLVELDGRQYHRGHKEFDDMWRDNELSLDGAVTFRFGAPHVAGGACHTARLVGRTLMALGWPGPVTSCRRCRAMPLDSW